MNNVASTQGFSDALVHLCGFLFVVLVLATLWLVVEAIGVWFRSQENKKNAPVVQKEAATVPEKPAGSGDQIPEEHLVVIASTVALMLGRQHRLVSIRNSGMDWSREGRRQHLQSHSYR
ncbi:OadG family protein [Desulfogranum mediterraneum]|uniref:OadG family protein n=1 Tax=Desulfogranum mediterraneum TaxID=160661 RepID=UPI00048C0695|nr:OadG family transporter subunit [Desulfogranum mediterraneum]